MNPDPDPPIVYYRLRQAPPKFTEYTCGPSYGSQPATMYPVSSPF